MNLSTTQHPRKHQFSRYQSIILILSFLAIFGITSCSNQDTDDAIISSPSGQLHELTVTLSGINTTLASFPEAPIYGMTRASSATAEEAGITHIALKVFNSDGIEVASIAQTSTSAGDDFNALKLQIPAGTYTFVAVAHSATADNIPCATIISPTEAILPEGIVPTLYCHVQEVVVSTTASSQSVTIDMGKRINTTLHITSADVVPEDVSSMTVDINPSGTSVKESAPAKFNPTTGFVLGNPRYGRKLSFIVGESLDATFNILLPEESYNYSININAKDVVGNVITEYTRTLENVPFQLAYVTNASGTYFRYVANPSLLFDLTIGSLTFNL